MSANGHIADDRAEPESEGNAADDGDRIDALILDVRRVSHRVHEVSLQVAAVEKSARDRGHKHADAMMVMTAELADIRHALREQAKVLGTDYDARASLHDMTAEELARVEAAGLRGQMRAVMATLATTKKTSGLAAGIGGVLSLEMMIRILLEILR